MPEANGINITFKSDPHAFQRLSEAETDPRAVLRELFREELIPDPDELADLVVARLGSKGFLIWPYERPQEPRKP